MSGEPMEPDAATDVKARVESLREEGNALHRARRYREAHSKYSQAIELDNKNAVLYANRAACSIALKEYLDAAADANKAATLDPKFAKAWARLGIACENLFCWENAIDAWKKALGCLPEDESKCTPTDLALKKQFTDGFKSALAGMSKMIEIGKTGPHVKYITAEDLATGGMPWQRAFVVADDTNRDSSAWVVRNAFADFSRGMTALKMTEQHGRQIHGQAIGLVEITNGILREPRVFHAEQEFFDKLPIHLRLEFNVHGGWPDAGPREVQRKALELQHTKGWDAPRRGISTTIRAWMLRAFLIWNNNQDHVAGLEYYKNAITVLEWGLHTWPDVPDSDRGVVFSPTFIRGIRRLYLEVYLAACKDLGEAKGYHLDTLADLANKGLEEIEANGPGSNDWWKDDYGFYNSFVAYPKAEAYATLGFVAIQKGLQARDVKDTERASTHFAESAAYYTKAGMLYPEDDEKRILYLWSAFEGKWHRGDRLDETLALLKRISDAYPAVEKIWEHSAFAPACRNDVACAQIFIQEAASKILEGVYTIDTPSSQINLGQNQEA